MALFRAISEMIGLILTDLYCQMDDVIRTMLLVFQAHAN